jgi:uncharacterized repeat protein (TIGR03803 family)
MGGANGDGNVFRINTDGSGYTDLFDFNGTNGYYPEGGLTVSGSTLYGTTYGNPISNGNILSINTDGSGYRDLFDFNFTDGALPVGSLTLSGSTLYGTTAEGGTYGEGTVFALNLASTPEPSTLVLLAAGALGLAGYAWRRRRRDAD